MLQTHVFDGPNPFGQGLDAVLQRAAIADNILSNIVDELKSGGLLAFPDIDPTSPEGSNTHEWYEIERTLFKNERAAIEAAILAANVGLSTTDLRQLLRSKNADPALPPDIPVDPIDAKAFAERTTNLLRFYDEALGRKPRSKANVGVIVGGIAVSLAVLGAILYFARK